MSPRMTHRLHRPAAFALLAGAAIAAAGCTRADASRLGSAADAAAKVYVPPGSYDEFYAFMSGGFDGQVGVYGLPSGRLLKHVPVFSQNPENGWGYSEQTKAMLATSYGQVPWDDAHHPQLSQTAGVPDLWLMLPADLRREPRVVEQAVALVATTFPLDLRQAGTANDCVQISQLADHPLEQIRVPTLLVHGTADKSVPYTQSLAAAQLIPGAEVVTIQNGTHLSTVFAPEGIEAIRGFLP